MAIFTIPNAFGIDVENQTLINHKCFCGALNHYFYKIHIFDSASFVSHSVNLTKTCPLNLKAPFSGVPSQMSPLLSLSRQ